MLTSAIQLQAHHSSNLYRLKSVPPAPSYKAPSLLAHKRARILFNLLQARRAVCLQLNGTSPLNGTLEYLHMIVHME